MNLGTACAAKDPFFVSFMAQETKAAFEGVFEWGQTFVVPL